MATVLILTCYFRASKFATTKIECSFEIGKSTPLVVSFTLQAMLHYGVNILINRYKRLQNFVMQTAIPQKRLILITLVKLYSKCVPTETTRLCPDTIVPRHDCAQIRLCPDTIVPRHDCAQIRLCPDTIVPRHDCAQTRLCPDTIVPRHVTIMWSQSSLGKNMYICAQIHIWYPDRLTCYNKITKYSRRNTAADC